MKIVVAAAARNWRGILGVENKISALFALSRHRDRATPRRSSLIYAPGYALSYFLPPRHAYLCASPCLPTPFLPSCTASQHEQHNGGVAHEKRYREKMASRGGVT